MAVAGLMTTGCAVVDVRPLTTGRVDVAAYELRGPALAPLRREAQRLCPQGADILRQTNRDQLPADEAGRVGRWLQTAAAWVEPPRRAAQMMLVCKESAADLVLPAAAAAETAPTDAPASLPAGPITAEW